MKCNTCKYERVCKYADRRIKIIEEYKQDNLPFTIGCGMYEEDKNKPCVKVREINDNVVARFVNNFYNMNVSSEQLMSDLLSGFKDVINNNETEKYELIGKDVYMDDNTYEKIELYFSLSSNKLYNDSYDTISIPDCIRETVSLPRLKHIGMEIYIRDNVEQFDIRLTAVK